MNPEKSRAKLFVISIIGLLIIGAGLWFAMTWKQSVNPQAESQIVNVAPERLELTGDVVEINPESGEIVIQTLTTSEKTVHIEADTKIVQIVSRFTSDGEPGYYTQELNINDLQLGTEVAIRYWGEGDNILLNVDEIFVTQEVQHDDLLVSNKLFTQGTILSFTEQSNRLEYTSPALVASAPKSVVVRIPDDMIIYTVSDTSRVGIIHALEVGSITDLMEGAEVFIEYSRDEENGVSIPVTVIVSK